MSSLLTGWENFEQFYASIRRYQTPTLLWYSVPGERVELSGKVLDNWISKSANFLVDECEIESGSSLDILMGAHWRSVVITLATLRVGAKVSFSATGAETVVTFDPALVDDLTAEYPVVVDRGPLSPRFMGTLPADAVDYCAEVRAHGDIYSGFELPTDSAPAFSKEPYSALFTAVREKAVEIDAKAQGFSAVQLLAPTILTPDYVIEALGVLASGRGLIILDPTLDWDDEQRVQRILNDERAVALSFDK